MLLWDKGYNGSPVNYADLAKAVAVDGSGNVVVTGTSQKEYYEDCYTAKYAAADGTLLWEKRYPGASHNNGPNSVTAMAVDGNGNVVVTGTSYGSTSYDFYTAKYAAADGALLWEQRYNGPANGNDGATSLALGPDGMVAVTGSSSGDYLTERTDAHVEDPVSWFARHARWRRRIDTAWTKDPPAQLLWRWPTCWRKKAQRRCV